MGYVDNMFSKIEMIIVDKDNNIIEDGQNLPVDAKIICKFTVRPHIRTMAIHWFEKTSFSKVLRNLYYKKAYDFYFISLKSDTHYHFNHKQAKHKYRFKW